MHREKANLKVGIIGCGNIANVHLRHVRRYVANGKIALCDKDEFRLDDFSKKVSVETKYDDLGKMMQEFHPDVVHILTPPATHKEIAIKCLEEGCHVLIEKPMCISSREADEIVKAAEQKEVLVCIDHTRLFDPKIIKVREIIESGSLGKIVNISTGYSYDFLKRANTDPTSKWINELPGGPFFDIIPHPLSLLEDFLSDLAVEQTFYWKNENNIITDLWCIFNSSSGSGTLHMSLNIFPLKNYIIFECTKGTLKVDFRNFLLLKRKEYGLPDAIERVFGNLSVGTQILKGTIGNVFSFLHGKLDSYWGLDWIIQKFYIAIIDNGKSPVPPEKANLLLSLTEKIFSNGLEKKKYMENDKEKQLTEMDVLVTGGTGFIGHKLVKKLLERGYKVRVLTHRNISNEELNSLFLDNSKVEVVCGDIYNYRDVEKACSGVNTVYHLAAATRGDWNYHIDTTITGTKNALTAASKVGVKRFVYVSTLNVYNAEEYPRNGFINEDFPYENRPEKRGFYSNAKLRAEKMVREFAEKSKMSICILRPGLVYGPGGKVFPQDVGFRLGKKLVVVMGNGKRRLPLVYVENVVEGLLVAGELGGRGKGIFNIVDKDYPTKLEYIKMYKRLSGERLLTVRVPMWIIFCGFWVIDSFLSILFKKPASFVYKLKSVSKSVRHSTERIENTLGWKQKVFFEEGLKLTLLIYLESGSEHRKVLRQ